MIRYLACSIVLAAGAAASAEAQSEFRLPPDVELTRDVEFGKGGDRALRLHLVRPKNRPADPMPVLVYIHGGAWSGGSRDGGLGHASRWARRGFLGVSIEYRLSGEARFPAQIEDCKCAIRFLRAKAAEFQLDPDRIGVCGHSAGGHLSALVGTSEHLPELEGGGGWAEYSSRVQAVCDISGPAHFPLQGDKIHPAARALLGGTAQDNPELAALAGPITHVRKSTPPFLIIHGDKDEVVSVRQSRILYDALQKVGAESTLLIIQDGGHHPFTAETTSAMDDFFDRHLRSKPGRKEPAR